MIKLHILFAVAFMAAICSLAFALSYSHSQALESHSDIGQQLKTASNGA
jgi:hypothetical protein